MINFTDQRDDENFVEVWVDNRLMGSFHFTKVKSFLDNIFDGRVTFVSIEGRNHFYKRSEDSYVR